MQSKPRSLPDPISEIDMPGKLEREVVVLTTSEEVARRWRIFVSCFEAPEIALERIRQT